MAPSRRNLQALRLLCTNDDGILAQGLACLIEAAEPLGEITVVAPDREQSATSHSLTLHHPIRPIERGERRVPGAGTPTHCGLLAGSRRVAGRACLALPAGTDPPYTR